MWKSTGLSSYWLTGPSPPPDQRAGLVMGFAAVPEADIAQALARLRQGVVAVKRVQLLKNSEVASGLPILRR